MKRFRPNTETVNTDREYYTEGESFFKHDFVINRGVNEAEKLRVLHHKHIQKYITSGIRGTAHIMKTEFFEGETLENLRLGIDDIIRVKSQLLDVVAYLTFMKMTHGDINVSNVLWNGQGICVIDWETATFTETDIDILGKHPHSGVLNTIKALREKLK